jgi:Fe-S cluster biogenesis protein NfuA
MPEQKSRLKWHKQMETIIKESLLQRVERALETIRPFLIADGGNIEVVDLTDTMELLVMMTGSCDTCQMKDSTLKGGVEGTIMGSVPEIKKVIAV